MTANAGIIPVGQEPPALYGPERTPPTARSAKKTAESPKRATGRWGMLNDFADFTSGTLSPTEQALWYQLYRNERDGRVQISQAELARRIRRSDRTVRTVLRKLESVGLVEDIRRGSLNRGLSIYRIRARRKDDG